MNAGIQSPFKATKAHVLNRGVPPDSFLRELVEWGKSAAGEIFAQNDNYDVYSSVAHELGPWEGLPHRRAVMLEVMRVLAGFESSWNWKEAVDVTNSTSVTPDTIEAGAWQVSANSIRYGEDLKLLVLNNCGTLDGDTFQHKMKHEHAFAMEYIARLLRHTVHHNGPVARKEINPWLRRDAVTEFQQLIT